MCKTMARYSADDEEGVEKWETVEGTIFDRYDVASFSYGWVFGLQEEPGSEMTDAQKDFVLSLCYTNIVVLFCKKIPNIGFYVSTTTNLNMTNPT